MTLSRLSVRGSPDAISTCTGAIRNVTSAGAPRLRSSPVLFAAAPALATNDTCGSGPDACLPYQRLPATQTYWIEAAAGAGQRGAFQLSVTRPRSPSGLGQFQSDGSTTIPVGGSATSQSVVFKGTVADPSLGAQLRLGPVAIGSMQIVVLAASVLLVAILAFVIQSTRVGRAVRAVAENRDVARLLGVSASRITLTVFVLSGAGYFFSGAVMGLIGDFQRLGKVLLVIVVLGIAGFYLAERLWLSRKVEEADPERFQEFEQAAAEKLQDLRQEFQEHIPFKQHRTEEKKRIAKREGDGD